MSSNNELFYPEKKILIHTVHTTNQTNSPLNRISRADNQTTSHTSQDRLMQTTCIPLTGISSTWIREMSQARQIRATKHTLKYCKWLITLTFLLHNAIATARATLSRFPARITWSVLEATLLETTAAARLLPCHPQF